MHKPLRLRTTAGITVKAEEVSVKDRRLPGYLDHLRSRPYQVSTLLATQQIIEDGPKLVDLLGRPLLERGRKIPRILIGGPTGCGKGTMIAATVAFLSERNPKARFVIAAPRREIARQQLADLRRIRSDNCSLNFQADRPIQVTTIQTLISRIEQLPVPDVLILDEGHHMRNNTWESVIAKWSSALLLGFSATTIRADNSELGNIYDILIVSCNYSDLLALGKIIVQADLYRPERYLDGHLAWTPVDAYRMYARGPTIVYEKSIDHARNTLRAFHDAGILAGLIVEGTKEGVRDELLERFKLGELPVLVNVDVLTEGVNLVNATTGILARDFAELARYKQAVGRILRYDQDNPNKRALVIDLTGASNDLKSAYPTDDFPYRLSITQSRIDSGGRRTASEPAEANEAQIRNCPLFDARTGVEVQIASPPSTPVQEYIEELRLKVRAGKLSPKMAQKRYHYRFGVYPLGVNFR